MALALGLARRGLGRVWPNPAVGCVIVDVDGHVAGRGWTQSGGRPHAETEALRQAGSRARGATAFVSLEPCSHHGKTPPCAQALIDAGLARVVSAIEDPDARVSGAGHALLQAAGLAMRTRVLASQAAELNAGFFCRIKLDRPEITLKLATTLDGKIALPSGESRWITGESARAHVHLLRARHDAIMIGIGSVLADDPELTCRLPGLEASKPVRIVLDTNARLPLGSKLVRTAQSQPVWLLSAPNAETMALQAAGVKIITLPAGPNGLDLSLALKALAQEGLTRILVEGGAALATSLLRAKFVDRLLWFRAPAVMGAGIPAVASLGLASLGDMSRFRHQRTVRLGDDALETYRAAP
ncbi:MAG: bifunctional diaminohydroxyphosphoribosylaminopyrimidine deaminase/5-amino-6-(5-phosphoribosylamino)uracil reductase RibD [Alphaproteobacteria bacterium]|nr:bifunctional diaminohydroxyphosphoribosylaminopyrimidine deaminase/5-amino-6-(5-phosphoribosylamino)uracil reductase RibD [Alphaproteobacteria bacterium]